MGCAMARRPWPFVVDANGVLRPDQIANSDRAVAGLKSSGGAICEGSTDRQRRIHRPALATALSAGVLSSTSSIMSRGRDDAITEACARLRKGAVSIRPDLLPPRFSTILAGDYEFVVHLAAIVGVQTSRAAVPDVADHNASCTSASSVLRWADKAQSPPVSSSSEVYAGSLLHLGMPVPPPETTRPGPQLIPASRAPPTCCRKSTARQCSCIRACPIRSYGRTMSTARAWGCRTYSGASRESAQGQPNTSIEVLSARPSRRLLLYRRCGGDDDAALAKFRGRRPGVELGC